jgi:hypothetical protein
MIAARCTAFISSHRRLSHLLDSELPLTAHLFPSKRSTSAGIQDRRPRRIDISHQLSTARVAIGMVPFREGKIADTEVALAHSLDIDA